MRSEPEVIVRRWLPLAVVTTALCLLVYATVQHSLRSGANDPQVQLAEDAVSALERRDALESVIPPGNVRIESSLAPFVIAFDSAGRPLAGSGSLRGTVPAPPRGVFDFVRANGADRVTWQPDRGVRIAAVVARVSGSPAAFVLAGRSLREVEEREAFARYAAAITWAAALGASLLVIGLGEFLARPSA
jgi:hypothetical protein